MYSWSSVNWFILIGYSHQHLHSTEQLRQYVGLASLVHRFELTSVVRAVPGPTPYATTSPTVATTPWPTTATWNTALQPSTVPTQVPGGGAAPTSPSSPAQPSTTPVSTPISTSRPSSTPVSVPSATPTGQTASLYGQCGGIGWTGPTACACAFPTLCGFLQAITDVFSTVAGTCVAQNSCEFLTPYPYIPLG